MNITCIKMPHIINLTHTLCHLGKGGVYSPKRMNFRKSSKRPLTKLPPPPFFGKYIVSFSRNSWPKFSFFNTKICNENFWIRNDLPSNPISNFRKIHSKEGTNSKFGHFTRQSWLFILRNLNHCLVSPNHLFVIYIDSEAFRRYIGFTAKNALNFYI